MEKIKVQSVGKTRNPYPRYALRHPHHRPHRRPHCCLVSVKKRKGSRHTCAVVTAAAILVATTAAVIFVIHASGIIVMVTSGVIVVHTAAIVVLAGAIVVTTVSPPSHSAFIMSPLFLITWK